MELNNLETLMNLHRFLLFVGLALSACGGDPLAPNASGTISLASTADAGGLVSVEVRFCPADAGVSPSCGAAGFPLAVSLKPDGGFPVPYRVGGDRLGTSPFKDWKVVAWVNRADAGAAPAPGDWWGEASLVLRECMCSTPPCYCAGGTVDVTIDRVAP